MAKIQTLHSTRCSCQGFYNHPWQQICPFTRRRAIKRRSKDLRLKNVQKWSLSRLELCHSWEIILRNIPKNFRLMPFWRFFSWSKMRWDRTTLKNSELVCANWYMEKWHWCHDNYNLRAHMKGLKEMLKQMGGIENTSIDEWIRRQIILSVLFLLRPVDPLL